MAAILGHSGCILGAIDIVSQLTGVPGKYHRSIIIVKGHRLAIVSPSAARDSLPYWLRAFVTADWFSSRIGLRISLSLSIIGMTPKFQFTLYTLHIYCTHIPHFEKPSCHTFPRAIIHGDLMQEESHKFRYKLERSVIRL